MLIPWFVIDAVVIDGEQVPEAHMLVPSNAIDIGRLADSAKLVPAPVVGSMRVTLLVFWFVVQTYRPSNATPLGPPGTGRQFDVASGLAYHANVAICVAL